MDFKTIGARMTSKPYVAMQYDIMNLVTNIGNVVDALKKHTIYGDDISFAYETLNNATPPMSGCFRDPAAIERMSDPLYVRLNHGVLGMISESSELVEALQKYVVDGEPIDRVNIIEEVGDILWYGALLLRSLDSNFEECGYINFEKLHKRFGDKFSEDSALIRNLGAERAILETFNKPGFYTTTLPDSDEG